MKSDPDGDRKYTENVKIFGCHGRESTFVKKIKVNERDGSPMETDNYGDSRFDCTIFVQYNVQIRV